MSKLFLSLLLLASLKASAQTTIPFTLSDQGHIIIKAKVDGVEGNFIFDTGAGLNLLFDEFAQKLAHRTTYHFFTGHRATGEPLTIPLYHSDDLQIGDAEFKNQLYTTFDISFSGIDGLISLQTFQHVPVTIDYEKKQIIIGELKAEEKKRFIDIQLDDEAGNSLDVFTHVKINDKATIQVSLDAGAGSRSFWLNDRLVGVLGVDTTGFMKVVKTSEFDSTKTNRFSIGPIGSLATENGLARVKNPQVVFIQGLIYEGKTSIEWLGKKIAISIPDKKIYIIKTTE